MHNVCYMDNFLNINFLLVSTERQYDNMVMLLQEIF